MAPLRVLATLCALFTSALAVEPLVVQGSQFVNDKTKDRFEIIGVDYQPGGQSGYKPDQGIDPLSDADVCLRDAVLLQRLGVNTIRIYNLNPDINHDECVSIFNAAGIYMILDVNSPLAGENLDRTNPKATYHKGYLNRIFSVVEAFKDYPNVLGFFGGNEVINEDAVKDVPEYLRAVNRDLKDYISKHASRAIPVGYSAADVRDILQDSWNYLSCEISDSPNSRIDFFGLNSYSWCGDSSYTTAGYDKLVAMFSDTSVPVFFSEYGCNEVTPRIFTEVQALYGDKMTDVMAGGLVYEYSQEKSNYGLVTLNDNNTASLREDYDNLLDQYKKLDVDLLQSLNASGANIKPKKCSGDLITTANFLNTFDIPDTPEGGADLIKNGIKNPKNGKLVDVTKIDVSSTVYDSSGNEIKGLKLKILDEGKSNLPGENTSGSSSSSSGSGSTTGSAAEPTHSGAGKNKMYSTGLALVVVAFAVAFM